MKDNDQLLVAISTGGANNFPRLPELYLQAVENAGAAAVFIGPDVSIADAMTSYAGFIIPGGGDIDPLLYNEERTTEIDLEDGKRVKFDLALFSSALKKGKPSLGICYGMQLMNIAMGGTLYQDIGSQKEGALNHREGSHTIQVDDNPFVEAGQYEVNSTHHQAVNQMGRGLNAFAFSPDGVIEAFYSQQRRFLLGVQWHPERIKNMISERVFTSFIEACRDSK
jgi:putative glutamine amidotransferase